MLTITSQKTQSTLNITKTSVPLTAAQISIEMRKNPGDGALIILIPEGDFTMGLTSAQANLLLAQCPSCTFDNFKDALPVHTVGLDDYWIYQTEVTNEMYEKCVTQRECSIPKKLDSETRNDYYGNPTYNSYPVVHVDWFQASNYCHWAGGRLPTEAEWEKSARGTDGRLFPWGDVAPNSRLANVDPFVGDTVEVGSFPQGASPYGVLDMAGNVWEWVADWYDPDIYNGSYRMNPTGPAYIDPPYRAGRGGSWGWTGSFASAGFRDWWEPDEHGSGVGFRCVLDTAP